MKRFTVKYRPRYERRALQTVRREDGVLVSEAKHETRCSVCPNLILPGQWIRKAEFGGWMHEGCSP